MLANLQNDMNLIKHEIKEMKMQKHAASTLPFAISEEKIFKPKEKAEAKKSTFAKRMS